MSGELFKVYLEDHLKNKGSFRQFQLFSIQVEVLD